MKKRAFEYPSYVSHRSDPKPTGYRLDFGPAFTTVEAAGAGMLKLPSLLTKHRGTTEGKKRQQDGGNHFSIDALMLHRHSTHKGQQSTLVPPLGDAAQQDAALLAFNGMSIESAVGRERLLQEQREKGELDLNRFPTSESIRFRDLQLHDVVGRGVSSEVRLAKHVIQDRFVVLRAFKKSSIGRDGKAKLLRREIQLLRMIGNPFIVPIMSTFQDSRRLYIVQEAVLGGSLHKHLQQIGHFPPYHIQMWVCELVLCLEYMHEHSIVHRGIRPENILLSAKGHVRLIGCDFIKQIGERTFTFCGVPEFVSPEVLTGNGYTLDVDWWALGVTCYELLTGFNPFYAPTPFLVYQQILKQTPPPFTKELKQEDSNATAFTMGCLQKREKRRVGHGGAMAVKQHPFLKGADWISVRAEQVVPPWEPKLKSKGDTRFVERETQPMLPDVDDALDPLGEESLSLFESISQMEQVARNNSTAMRF